MIEPLKTENDAGKTDQFISEKPLEQGIMVAFAQAYTSKGIDRVWSDRLQPYIHLAPCMAISIPI
jgi:hypothetical protein